MSKEFSALIAAGRKDFILSLVEVISWLGHTLVVQRTLRSATGGASEWRPPLAWCVAASDPGEPPSPPAAASTPRAGPAYHGTHGISCASAGPQPLG